MFWLVPYIFCVMSSLLWSSGPVLAQESSGTAPTPATPSGVVNPAGTTSPTPPGGTASGGLTTQSWSPTLPDLTKRENFSAALQILVLLTVLSLAPAILIMMTSFTRIVIVLSLLRQALGTASLPPNQVLIGLSMFMTFLVMGPTMKRINGEALA